MEPGEAVLLAILAFMYFFPSLLAFEKGHRNKAAIFVLNIFLGWTFIGWVAALVWAVTKPATP